MQVEMKGVIEAAEAFQKESISKTAEIRRLEDLSKPLI